VTKAVISPAIHIFDDYDWTESLVYECAEISTTDIASAFTKIPTRNRGEVTNLLADFQTRN
jgi:hypothetical protein